MVKKTKILIVEDHKDLARMVQYNLENEGYEVIRAKDAETALPLAVKRKPGLIILDIMLPGMDGIEFFRTLRQTSLAPVIFLTAKKSEADRVLGLKMGADDYLTKPFSIGELVARVQAILRRTAMMPAENGREGKAFQLGKMEVDVQRHEVRLKGKIVELTPKEFELLKLLIESKGKVLSREDLLECVWGLDKSCDIDTRTVDQHISRLRTKLNVEKHRIATVTNYGYQFRLS